MFPSAPFGCLSLAAFFLLLVLFPLLFANVMFTALTKLGLKPELSLLIAFAIFLGGAVNIPVKWIPRDELVEVAPSKLFGLERMFPNLIHHRTYTVVAVNVGGCIIPCLIVVYELIRIVSIEPLALVVTFCAIAINTAVCYWIARPIPKVGIALPPIIPALVAAACGFMFMRDLAPLIAFSAGVLGPLIGADILHIRTVLKATGAGVASIGGAGTFDGIVLSGLVATLLA
ncbi:MAG: DUF1614 domain-containing protein [wastewater metagenome]|nr:DUF1614 domain-containing protein [Candidatus Loosdrechtia aerotolerans]